MKYLSAFLILISFASCQITETINLNSDGSGTIEYYNLRDENSFAQLGRQDLRYEKFRDTIFTFQDYITKYQEIFVRFNKEDQALFTEHANVKMHIKTDPVQMENFNRVTLDFKKIDAIPDIYESLGLANSLKENYPINRKSYRIKFAFDGAVFKRVFTITNPKEFEKDKKEWEDREKIYSKYKMVQSYTLKYSFPKKIKSVSNEKAIISSDKKSLTLEVQLLDCLKNPEVTNLEVVLE
ncbi:hypothetical protein [Flavobacterium sp. KACC 22761]|uniref:hypothetical protein n=1 Tax=Flavobacterium sp. KACC 22761 TaxID=3092665 RepID=UPI002A756941|nr:hypothetical protein [Flavobacterium sp. KACC 22761]WPO76914.1 hypothetical protein SCB73_11590 [Flavobacterium sp. KACC 22761]